MEQTMNESALVPGDNGLFSSSDYAQFIADFYGMDYLPATISVNDEKISLPLFSHKGLLVTGVLFEKTGLPKLSSPWIGDAFEALITKARDSNHHALRVFSLNPLQGVPNEIGDKVNMVLHLGDDKEQFQKALGAKKRSQIKRPLKEGYRYEVVNSGEGLKQFYQLYEESIHRLGSLAMPLSFFERFHSLYADNVSIYLGYIGDDIACTAVAVELDNEIFIPWAASKQAYMRVGVNMAMYWDLISMAFDKGKYQFNFGRSSRGSGTYDFKRRWGAEEQPLYRYTFPLAKESHLREKWISPMITKSPRWVMKQLSRLFIRRFY